MAGEHRADGASRERKPKPGAFDPFVEQRLDSPCAVAGRHGGKGSAWQQSNEKPLAIASDCNCVLRHLESVRSN